MTSNKIKPILCPVDLSDNGSAAIALATTIAKSMGTKLRFIYVAPQWSSDSALLENDYNSQIVAEDKFNFEKLRPTDPSVEFEHSFISGNAGPEIVRATDSNSMVVMSTHGHGGVMRLVMGSVAQYVLRNAKCPVVLFKNTTIEKSDDQTKNQIQNDVTSFMKQVSPVRGFDSMTKVLEELTKSDDRAAPVVDDFGKCIGILTLTDIDRYHELKKRFDEQDESVIDEVFDTDQFGQRRTNNAEFDQVKRHMTAPVITIKNTQTCERAIELFQSHCNIHHLVILDECDRPVGIAESADMVGCEFSKDC